MKRFDQGDWRVGLPADFVAQADGYTKRYWADVNAGNLIPEIIVREPVCPRCNDLGLFKRDVPITDPLFGKMFSCPDCAKGEEVEREQWRRKYQRTELPRAFQGFTFQSWADMLGGDNMEGKRAAYLAAVQFAEKSDCMVDLYQIFADLGIEWEEGRDYRSKNSLVFHGSVGTGKSGLMSAAVNEKLALGETCLYSRLDEFIEEYRSTYREDAEKTTEEVMAKHKHAPILFWDEVNIYGVKDDVLNKVESIIRYRYNNQLPTLMTTNLDQKSFLDTWKDRTADAASAMAHWIAVTGLKLRRTDPSVYDWQERADLR
jgi:hypothetical protein